MELIRIWSNEDAAKAIIIAAEPGVLDLRIRVCVTENTPDLCHRSKGL